MAKIESAFLDLTYLDRLATGNTVIHRLDPRVKVLIAALFVVCVVSFDKYAIAAMLPFAVFLMIIMGLGEIPAGYVITKLIVTSPFAVMVGIFNPLLDQQTVLQLGDWAISGGWVSFLSILLRFGLTVAAMLVLIATTGFNQVCMALERLGIPKIFAVQLLMLYRYIFVLLEEGQRMHRARSLRSFQKRGMEMKQYAYLLGQLLLRTIDRGQRIHLAMLCRGFDGTIRIRQTLRLTARDIVVFLAGAMLLIVMRRFNIALLLGNFITDLLQ
ncbi:MAG TPA: cobalt ECF transporter T component CbiQ [Desulfoprunum sp.]|nr:cobalt ECF transporter T component CbiQ [Desulfoprunum sp.]